MKLFAQITRVGLFFLVNLLVMFTIGAICVFFHIPQRIGAGNFSGLLVVCTLVGMGGSFVSLLLSKSMAKWMKGVEILDPQASDPEARYLIDTIYRLSKSAGLSSMPEVGVYQSPEINAFATGASQDSALVAVSTGLLRNMRSSDLEGVLGHEITHIANGDMVTMTLIQGIVNTIAMFMSWVLAIVLTQGSRDERDRGGNSFMAWMLADVLRAVFMFLGFLLVMWFSRWREFRADAGGARLAGRAKMIGALQTLKLVHEQGADALGAQQPAFQALMISGKTPSFLGLFASHPPLEERIARLEAMK